MDKPKRIHKRYNREVGMTEFPCNKCLETKPADEFYYRRTEPFERIKICKECSRMAARPIASARYERHKERLNAESTEARKHWTPEQRARANEQVRRRKLVADFGITHQEYDELLAFQQSVCAICKRPEQRMFRGKLRRLSVDHDHATGKIRGLLCSECNLALGLLGDDVEVFRAAIEYLTESLDALARKRVPQECCLFCLTNPCLCHLLKEEQDAQTQDRASQSRHDLEAGSPSNPEPAAAQ
jgi:hypothetical protein